MNNMRLVVKLALGFGILVAIIVFLGSVSVWQLKKVGRIAEQLSTESVPMVNASLDADRALRTARYEFRAYGLTGDDRYRLAGLPHLKATQAHLKAVSDLADKYSSLAGMKEKVKHGMDKTAEYATLVGETSSQDKEVEAIHARQNESASLFVSNSAAYLDSQKKLLEAQIQETATATNLTELAASLKERLHKVMRANEIISSGSRLWMSYWESAALRDPRVVQDAMKEFEVIDKKLSEIALVTRQEADKTHLDAMKSAAEHYKAAMKEYVTSATACAELGVDRDDVSEAALEAVGANTTVCIGRVGTMAAHASANLAQAVRIMLTGIVVAILIALMLMLVIIRGVFRQVGGEPGMIAMISEKIAAGDLTVDWRGGVKVPTGILASVGKMVDCLRQQACETREAAIVLASSASEISASVAQVTSGAQETSTAVTETTTTVEEVKQVAHLTSLKSKEVAENAHMGLQMAHAGRKAAETVNESMTRINEQMAAIADTIVKLGEQSQVIGEITSTVDDIAEQSNLLAVNAAVEAAKAGEHGRGFAVVAQEIKSLAAQSKQATKQVRGILNDIQKAAGAAVMATEQGGKAVEQGMQESLRANESIIALSASFTETVQSARQIAVSTQEQLTGMDQVASAMESIKEASAKNLESMRQLKTEAQTLKDIGCKFTELVERYKV